MMVKLCDGVLVNHDHIVAVEDSSDPKQRSARVILSTGRWYEVSIEEPLTFDHIGLNINKQAMGIS